MQDIRPSSAQVVSAAAIQEAIDALDGKGGRVTLPEMDLVLDRGLQKLSGVELVDQGERTVLRMAPGWVYPLAGYPNCECGVEAVCPAHVRHLRCSVAMSSLGETER